MKKIPGYQWTTSRWKNGWRNATETRFLSKPTLFRAGKTINWLLKGPRCTHQRCNIIYRPLSRSYFFWPQPPSLPRLPSFFPTAQAWNIKSPIFLHNADVLRSQVSPFPLVRAICWSYCNISRWSTRVTKFRPAL